MSAKKCSLKKISFQKIKEKIIILIIKINKIVHSYVCINSKVIIIKMINIIIIIIIIAIIMMIIIKIKESK